jgi:methionyl-tRNA formyltransferase
MRIVLFGQAAFGQQVLTGVLDAGHEVAAVYAPPPAGPKEDPLAAAASQRGVTLRTPKGYRTAEVAAEVRALDADLGVLAFVTKIIPEEVISAPRSGTICFHPSLLPRYRGGSALAWQLIRGEERGGFTVFWTDAGIDTGPILLQREIAIGPDDTAGSLYFDKIFAPGVAGMVEAVGLVAAGTAPRLTQDESQATYDPLCTDEHAVLSWDAPARQSYDLIRGCDPQPGAHTTFGGDRIRLFGARRLPGSAAGIAPGTVVEVGPEAIVVVAGGGSDAGRIAITKVRGAGGKVAAAEFAAASGLAPGARLGSA